MKTLNRFFGLWDRFLFGATDWRMWPVFRIGFGVLLCLYVISFWTEAEFFFSKDGVFPAQLAEQISQRDGRPPSIFFFGDDSVEFANICFAIFLAQSVMLMVGFLSRLQAVSLFIWLVSVRERCPIIFEGEDTVFRMFAFFSIFAPLSIRFSLDNYLFSKFAGRQFRVSETSGWAIRLIQFQMTAIYASTALEKVVGSCWQDGTALYYASRLHDLFGRFPVPAFVFENLWLMKAITWSVLVVECLLPILLWIPRTRILAVLLGFALHLGIEYSMNLLLFQWVMMLGLMMFLKADEIPFLKARLNRLEDGKPVQI